MPNFGFKYSIRNKKAEKNTNPKELGYSSQYETYKTFLQGNISYQVPDGLSSKTIRHGLSYRPAFNVYYRDSLTGEVYQTNTFHPDGSDREDAEISIEAGTDPYNLYLEIDNSSGGDRNVDIFYEIFYEDLVLEPAFFIG